MPFTMPTIDLDEFHRDLPRSVPIGSDRFDDLRPLAFVLPDGRSVTYRVVDGAVEWSTGTAADAATVIAIDGDSFGTFALEYLTAPALQIQQRIAFTSGGFGGLDRWEPVLRLLYVGRPVYEPSRIDRSTLDREFVWGEDPIEAIGAHYREHGFAIVRRVFDVAEIADLDAEIDRLAATADPDDGESWWVASGDEDRVCQVHFASLTSPVIDRLERDERIARLVAEIDPGFVAHPTTGVGHFVVIKNPGLTGGLTDLAWHVDCGLGGHPVMCPSMHIGVQVRAMTPESGPMMFLAGSHRTSPVRPVGDEERDWPVVTVTAEPGDITLHSPDAVHAAPPPTGAVEGRRTVYLSFGRPELSEVFGHKEGYDHIIFPREGHVSFDAE